MTRESKLHVDCCTKLDPTIICGKRHDLYMECCLSDPLFTGLERICPPSSLGYLFSPTKRNYSLVRQGLGFESRSGLNFFQAFI